ncbi:short-chain dehydrogenase [Purpureocillium lavendulum]|uniref:Short-chain dehydrogenase n=1 Tax=Purpureocillium lavendulum TaxID=1247861 RepID=A0AB34FRL1_9HYPO|nr:short-chain dehydrogenase [Purpureocillium lavendulum]
MPDSQAHHPLDFTCALVTGGGGGIGKALAQWLVSRGKKVLLAGRTESNLRAAAKEVGAAGYYVLDTGKTDAMPAFVRRLTAEHPDVDCLVNNAGVQRPLDVSRDAAEDFLARADAEIDINIRGPLHLALLLLPHLRARPHGACVVNVSSVLGFVPFSVVNPVYNGTKAWLHFWSMNLRTQLARDPALRHVRVVEIAPPMVGTDLHREREDPDDNKKHNNGSALTVEEFVDEVARKWEAGEDMITAGPGNAIVGQWYDTMGGKYPG